MLTGNFFTSELSVTMFGLMAKQITIQRGVMTRKTGLLVQCSDNLQSGMFQAAGTSVLILLLSSNKASRNAYVLKCVKPFCK
jgi:uncharacterized protein (DUF2141 family)